MNSELRFEFLFTTIPFIDLKSTIMILIKYYDVVQSDFLKPLEQKKIHYSTEILNFLRINDP